MSGQNESFAGNESILVSPPKLNKEEEERICIEFKNLQERCQHMFTGLRDLPQFGNWDGYFHRTFDVYLSVCTLNDN